MESSEENGVSISETLCPKMLVCLASRPFGCFFFLEYPDISHDFTNLICTVQRVLQSVTDLELMKISKF